MGGVISDVFDFVLPAIGTAVLAPFMPIAAAGALAGGLSSAVSGRGRGGLGRIAMGAISGGLGAYGGQWAAGTKMGKSFLGSSIGKTIGASALSSIGAGLGAGLWEHKYKSMEKQLGAMKTLQGRSAHALAQGYSEASVAIAHQVAAIKNRTRNVVNDAAYATGLVQPRREVYTPVYVIDPRPVGRKDSNEERAVRRIASRQHYDRR